MMSRKRTTALITLSVLLATSGVALGQSSSGSSKSPPPAPVAASKPLTMGDPAPALEVSKWLKGEEIKGFEKGTIYIVDFWCSEIGNCRKSIPLINDLAKKYKDKGVKALGVSIWEDTREKDVEASKAQGKNVFKARDPLPNITKFIAEMGDKMTYSVAYGGDDAPMAKTWMNAASRISIPSTFVVDREGRFVWVGHPNEGLEATVQSLIEGKYDAKAASDDAKKQAEKLAKGKDLGNRLRAALQGGRGKESTDIVREMVKLDPTMFPNAIGVTFVQLTVNMKEEELAYEFVKEMFAGPMKDSWQDLNTVAWTILDDAGVKRRDVPLAREMAKRAVELTQSQEGGVLDTLARAYWDSGDAAKALETQLKAVEAAKNQPDMPAAIKQQLDDALALYKKGKK